MRSLKQILAGCTAVLGVVVFGSSQGFATPISASMSVTADAQIDGVTASKTSTDFWGVPLTTLKVGALATAVGSTGTSLTAAGIGAASWGAGGNSGTVRFGGFGWTTVLGLGGQDTSESASVNSGGPDWTYTFVADFNGTFTLNYDITGLGDFTGLNGWAIDWTGAGGGLDLMNASDPTASGSFVRSLLAGQTYTVSLQNGAQHSTDNTAFPNGSMGGLFTFDMVDPPAPVPEPGSLAVLLASFASLGVLRRRKKQ